MALSDADVQKQVGIIKCRFLSKSVDNPLRKICQEIDPIITMRVVMYDLILAWKYMIMLFISIK